MNMAESISILAGGLRGVLRREEPMSKHTSWRVGGPAERAYLPADLDDLCAFLGGLPADEPVYAIGLGSNLLVRDGGLRGTVVFMHHGLQVLRLDEGRHGRPLVYAEAGVASPKVARFAANHGFEGAEFLAGIPGTVGGALAMNAGCYGSETWDVVERVLTLDHGGQLRTRLPGDYEIGYRHCRRKGNGHREWFAAAWFRLQPGDGEASRERIKALLTRRIASQPINQPNAGSVFRNPPGDHAARLIEACGLKGHVIGGAQVSSKHANFIVNSGTATAADIEQLMGHVQATVENRTGIALVREVLIVGEP
ncbi:MAG: UDP-N-acetylmuramate dehydrogenase [Burkholderiales bacterium]